MLSPAPNRSGRSPNREDQSVSALSKNVSILTYISFHAVFSRVHRLVRLQIILQISRVRLKMEGRMVTEVGPEIDGMEMHFQEKKEMIQSDNQEAKAEAGSDASIDDHDNGVAVAAKSGNEVEQEHRLRPVSTFSAGNHVMAGQDEYQADLGGDHNADQFTDSMKFGQETSERQETSEQCLNVGSKEEVGGSSGCLRPLSFGSAGSQTSDTQHVDHVLHQPNPSDTSSDNKHDIVNVNKDENLVENKNNNFRVAGEDGITDGPESPENIENQLLGAAGGDGPSRKNVSVDTQKGEVHLEDGKWKATRDMAVDTKETLKYPSKQSAAASQSSSDSTEVLPQPSTEPPLPTLLPPVEFAKKVLSIDGVIASGKTTLLETFLKEYGKESENDVAYVFEPVEYYKTFTSVENKEWNPLQEFYSDQKGNSTAFQLHVLDSFVKQRKDLQIGDKKSILCERNITSSIVFTNTLFKSGTITQLSRDFIISKTHTAIQDNANLYLEPTAIFFIDTPLQVCSQRKVERNRDEEKNARSFQEYQQLLRTEYLNYLDEFKKSHGDQSIYITRETKLCDLLQEFKDWFNKNI